jgi:hypothetical protein
MKKLILIAVLIFVAVTTYGQTLQKGNFVGYHVLAIDLKQNVTMDQYLDMYKNKLIPALDKNFQGEWYLTKGLRGECENCYGVIIVWKSEADCNKFWKKEGGLTDLGQTTMDKLKPLIDELEKLGTATSKYTDWIVQ